MSLLKKVAPFFINAAISAGVIADHWHGVTAAGNLSLAFIWVVLFPLWLIFIFSDDKDTLTPKDGAAYLSAKALSLSAVAIVLFAAGWFASGAFLLVFIATYACYREMK